MDITAKIRNKSLKRLRRHKRVRQKIYGTALRPRLCIYKSLKHIYAQVIDDRGAKTLLTVSTLSADVKDILKSTNKTEMAKIVGRTLGQRVLALGIKKVVFDRGGYKFHGRIKALAEAAKQEGLEF